MSSVNRTVTVNAYQKKYKTRTLLDVRIQPLVYLFAFVLIALLICAKHVVPSCDEVFTYALKA